MRFMIVSSSLSTPSNSLVLAREAEKKLKSLGHDSDFVDLSDNALPLCGAPGSFNHELAGDLAGRLGRADGVLLAGPVYNYDVNAGLKNFVELTGKGWEGKVVGFLLSAGGHASYMSALGLANSLMLDFRCLILPRFVYALSKEHFKDGLVSDPDIRRRVDELALELVRVAGALKRADETPAA
ncbi:MAG: NADPH-dependent FMN reductase [bacterium]